MPKKDYIKRDITLVGRTQPNEEGDKECEVCTEADQFLSNATKHDNRITYRKIEVDTEEGRKIAEDEDVQGLPYIKDCRTFEPGQKPRCREIEGFSAEDDFSDLSELIEKDTEKAEEEIKEEIKEPVEPSEPK
jgi:hypothetical protein